MKLMTLLHSKLFLAISALMVAATAVVSGILLKNNADEYRVIKVFEVIGRAIVTRASLGDLEPYTGMNLESGDIVSTASDSSMRLVLDNTKYVLLEPDSSVELTASGDPSDNKTAIVLKYGSILNEITEPLSTRSSYEVSAPKATMAVRGTSFRVSVQKDENGDYITTLYVFHGTVKVGLLDEAGKSTDRTADAGQDQCIIIKTVHNDKSRNDASDDGYSFFCARTGTAAIRLSPREKVHSCRWIMIPFRMIRSKRFMKPTMMSRSFWTTPFCKRSLKQCGSRK